jgi:Mrp family chromosome partitioning ATPase
MNALPESTPPLPAGNPAHGLQSRGQGFLERLRKPRPQTPEPRPYARLDVPLLEAIDSLRELSDDLWPKLVRRNPRGGTTRYLFTAPHQGTGTTLISAAAALGLARNLREGVVLAELNTERPALASYLAAGEGPGVGELLSGSAEPSYCRIEVGDLDKLQVFAAGEAKVLEPGDFARERMDRVARDFEARGQYVIYDAPPLLEYPGTLLLGEQVDAVVLVVRGRETTKRELDRCIELITQADMRIAGLIFNRFESDLPFGLGAGG